ncbi:RNA-directed DNA polymerase, eukaryota, reverse transcriptase zinc-binding domain protein [Tanacetum coccineum]
MKLGSIGVTTTGATGATAMGVTTMGATTMGATTMGATATTGATTANSFLLIIPSDSSTIRVSSNSSFLHHVTLKHLPTIFFKAVDSAEGWRWDPAIGMEEKEKTKILVWAKLINVPLEAWSKEGISALSSSLGKPLIMDTMTTQMCKYGFGRLEYARVLVEFDVKKGFKEKIEVQYRNKENEVKGSKTVKDENVNVKKNSNVQSKVWPIQKDNLNAMKKTANKYVVLSEMNEEERNELNVLKDRIIEKWAEDRLKEDNKDAKNLEDVIENEEQVDYNWLAVEIKGGDATVLN